MTMPGVWKKTLVYLGLAEDDEYDEYGYDEFAPDDGRDRDGAPVRRLPEREKRDQEDEFGRGKDAVVRAMPSTSTGTPRVHLVTPTAFNDAQEVGDKFRDGFSVLMNLQAANPELSAPAGRLRQRSRLRPLRFDATGGRQGLSDITSGRRGVGRRTQAAR